MDWGQIIVGRTDKEIAKSMDIKNDYDELEKQGLEFASRGYEEEGYGLTKVGRFKAKIDKVDTNENIWGIPIAYLYNEAIDYGGVELQQRISEGKRIFKDITGLEGRVWIIGYQT